MSVSLTLSEYNNLRDSLTISNNTIADYKKANDGWSAECDRVKKQRDIAIEKNNSVVKKYNTMNSEYLSLKLKCDKGSDKYNTLFVQHNELKLKYEKKTTSEDKYKDLLSEFKSLSVEHETLLKHIKDKEEEDSPEPSESEDEKSESDND